ncbi:MAG: pyridoxamine 5'-phosphate oxidase [Bacteroidales bacterium]|nr:MAG: pyridoxamine 5'-phosphate oxidase [Bacteroidales bacterium]
MLLKNLHTSDVASDPLEQFKQWFSDAVESGNPEPEAMNLSTATNDGKPSSRMVLLKEVDREGFVFFTNYESRKGLEISENPHAAVTFYWPELARQIRIEGTVHKITAAESDSYFSGRPVASQIGAVVSPQSREIPDRQYLNNLTNTIGKENDTSHIPRPAFWGGYRLIPLKIEFWQEQPNRLHDRILYRLERNRWKIVRLAP